MPGQALNVAPSLAAALAARGVSSLRFDKRGVGESSGGFLETGFERETDDATVALLALRHAEAVDPARVTVVGHSVGATIAIRLAARHCWVAGAVLLSGACTSGVDVMREQSERIAASFTGLRRFAARWFLRRQARVRDELLASTGDTVRVGGAELPARWFRE